MQQREIPIPFTEGGTEAETQRDARRNMGSLPEVDTKGGTSYTAVSSDLGKAIEFSSGSPTTLNLTAAATLTEGWFCYLVTGANTCTIDPNASETIDGTTTKVITADSGVMIICDGQNFRTVGVPTVSGSTDTDAIHDNVDGEISAIAAKATPTSSDYLLIEDAADSDSKKSITIGDLPSTSSDTDAIHDNVAAEISAIAAKGTPTVNDYLVIEDAADSDNKKSITIGNLPSNPGTAGQGLEDNTGTWQVDAPFNDKTSNYTAVAADRGEVIRFTDAASPTALTLSLTAAATLGDGWYAYVRNDTTGTLTIDPNGSEQINDGTTYSLPDDSGVLVMCDGSEFVTVGSGTGGGGATAVHVLGETDTLTINGDEVYGVPGIGSFARNTANTYTNDRMYYSPIFIQQDITVTECIWSVTNPLATNDQDYFEAGIVELGSDMQPVTGAAVGYVSGANLTSGVSWETTTQSAHHLTGLSWSLEGGKWYAQAQRHSSATSDSVGGWTWRGYPGNSLSRWGTGGSETTIGLMFLDPSGNNTLASQPEDYTGIIDYAYVMPLFGMKWTVD